jgi:hypothetical protein
MPESTLDWMLTNPGTYWGLGDGEESGQFIGRIEIVCGLGRTVDVGYEAWSDREGLQHAERTRLAPTTDGGAQLIATITEAPAPLIFRETQVGEFVTVEGPEMKIIISVEDNALSYAWWWAPAGEVVREQSRLIARRVVSWLDHQSGGMAQFGRRRLLRIRATWRLHYADQSTLSSRRLGTLSALQTRLAAYVLVSCVRTASGASTDMTRRSKPAAALSRSTTTAGRPP